MDQKLEALLSLVAGGSLWERGELEIAHKAKLDEVNAALSHEQGLRVGWQERAEAAERELEELREGRKADTKTVLDLLDKVRGLQAKAPTPDPVAACGGPKACVVCAEHEDVLAAAAAAAASDAVVSGLQAVLGR